jgi:hypothetical protein
LKEDDREGTTLSVNIGKDLRAHAYSLRSVVEFFPGGGGTYHWLPTLGRFV